MQDSIRRGAEICGSMTDPSHWEVGAAVLLRIRTRKKSIFLLHDIWFLLIEPAPHVGARLLLPQYVSADSFHKLWSELIFRGLEVFPSRSCRFFCIITGLVMRGSCRMLESMRCSGLRGDDRRGWPTQNLKETVPRAEADITSLKDTERNLTLKGATGDGREQIPGRKETGDYPEQPVWKLEKTRHYGVGKRLSSLPKIIHISRKLDYKITYWNKT